MDLNLTGRVAAITGGAAGIVLEAALEKQDDQAHS